MQERISGCICELDPITSNPTFNNYAECPIHKPDAPDPKNSAKDLVRLYDKLHFESLPDSEQRIKYAKWSASICVDEILNVLDTFQRHEYAKVLIPFYQQVKNEIEII